MFLLPRRILTNPQAARERRAARIQEKRAGFLAVEEGAVKE
jgi:hypothetical protein